jgi:hypothetical protein
MDQAPLRRGAATVHTKFGTNTAILAGDVVMIMSYEYLRKVEPQFLPQILGIFNKTALEVSEGQQLDMDFEKRDTVHIDEYINMITLKTSVLLAASLSMGACIGAVVGLVAITPAAGFVSIAHAITIGIISSIVSNLAVSKFPKGKIDDALDVFACHGVGGMTGMILTGVFASNTINPTVVDQGLLFGETKLFLNQITALIIVSIFAFTASYALFFITNKITRLRVSEDKEEIGLDITQHGEFL